MSCEADIFNASLFMGEYTGKNFYLPGSLFGITMGELSIGMAKEVYLTPKLIAGY